MHNDNSNSRRRSLGALRKTPKTKPKSPDTQGIMKVQRHIETIMQQLDDDDSDEVAANIAGWLYSVGSDRYITVELSPRFVKRNQVLQDERINTFEAFFQDKENFH